MRCRWAWVAEAGRPRAQKSNLVKYQQFVAEGSMTVTPGDVIDKTAVLKFLELADLIRQRQGAGDGSERRMGDRAKI